MIHFMMKTDIHVSPISVKSFLVAEGEKSKVYLVALLVMAQNITVSFQQQYIMFPHHLLVILKFIKC